MQIVIQRIVKPYLFAQSFWDIFYFHNIYNFYTSGPRISDEGLLADMGDSLTTLTFAV